MKSIQLKSAAIVVIASIGLTACGGNGGTTATTPVAPVVPVTPVIAAVSSIVTTVSPANYAAGTFKRAKYDYLNAQRQTCGFGLLQQNTQLDAVAQAHTDWMFHYGQSTHFESQSLYPTGFTGYSPVDRMMAAGYAWIANNGLTNGDELLSIAANPYGTTYGQAAVMDFFVAPYHGMGQLLGVRDIGIGNVNSPANIHTSETEWHNTDFGTTASRPSQLLGANDVATYPCNGVTGTLTKSYADEVPAPIPGRNIGYDHNPIGHPIYIKIRDGQTLVLTAYDLRAVGTNTSLPLILLNRSSDTRGLLDDSIAILMPNAPLTINTSYLFKATGTNNGQAITVNFTFATGAF